MTRRAAPIDDIRRGDVVWVNCDPSVGVEPRKTRTCVVVSNDIANRYGQAITIVQPIAAKTSTSLWPGLAWGLGGPSQITS